MHTKNTRKELVEGRERKEKKKNLYFLWVASHVLRSREVKICR